MSYLESLINITNQGIKLRFKTKELWESYRNLVLNSDDPLDKYLVSLSWFDSTYMYSDDIVAWRNGNDHEKKLKELFKCIPERQMGLVKNAVKQIHDGTNDRLKWVNLLVRGYPDDDLIYLWNGLDYNSSNVLVNEIAEHAYNFMCVLQQYFYVDYKDRGYCEEILNPYLDKGPIISTSATHCSDIERYRSHLIKSGMGNRVMMGNKAHYKSPNTYRTITTPSCLQDVADALSKSLESLSGINDSNVVNSILRRVRSVVMTRVEDENDQSIIYGRQHLSLEVLTRSEDPYILAVEKKDGYANHEFRYPKFLMFEINADISMQNCPFPKTKEADHYLSKNDGDRYNSCYSGACYIILDTTTESSMSTN